MKAGHTYSINPVPFVSIVANPKGRRRGKTKRRNPVKSRSKAGIYVIRKPTRNPAPVATAPMKKSRRKSRISARKTAKAAPRRNPRRKARRNPRKKVASTFSVIKPMSTKRKRRRGSRRRNRNPMSRGGARRRSGRRSSPRRNPAGRRKRRGSYRRNPGGMIADFGKSLFGPDMLSLAGGVVISSVGTTMIMNKLISANPTTGQRSFDLPLVDYSMLANPATAGTFYTKNAWILAGYKLVIGGLAGYLLRNQSPRLSRGLLIGTVATTVSDVLKNTGILSAKGTLSLTRGTGRNYPARGTGMIPGTNTRFTGPAQSFLTMNNVPRPRGMGAAVGPGFVTNTESMVPSAFTGAN